MKRYAKILITMSLSAMSVFASAQTAVPTTQTAVFAGGCFWGADAVFKHVKGVVSTTSGYSGGSAQTAQYERVSDGDTGHAEAVRVVFDPAKVSYEKLLEVFFNVAHNPRQLNFQGPDTGTQYRSAVFFTSSEQQHQTQKYMQRLAAEQKNSGAIVTQLVPLQQFYPAEKYHQNYLALHPNEPYIVIHDQPKLLQLRKSFPDLYQ